MAPLTHLGLGLLTSAALASAHGRSRTPAHQHLNKRSQAYARDASSEDTTTTVVETFTSTVVSTIYEDASTSSTFTAAPLSSSGEPTCGDVIYVTITAVSTSTVTATPSSSASTSPSPASSTAAASSTSAAATTSAIVVTPAADFDVPSSSSVSEAASPAAASTASVAAAEAPATTASSTETTETTESTESVAAAFAEVSAPATSAASSAAASSTAATSSAATSSAATSSAATSSAATSSAAVATGSAYDTKRGCLYNTAADCSILASDSISWAANWGSSADGSLDDLVFTPQLWGQTSSGGDIDFTSSWAANAAAAIAAGAKAVLGYNEPDCSTQAALSPSEGYALWDLVTAFADQATVVSPAVTSTLDNGDYTGLDWLTEFAALGATWDATAVHFYASCDYDTTDTASFQSQLSYLEAFITEASSRFGKSVWLTEFGCDSGATPEQIAAFLTIAIPYLEGEAAVVQYLAFEADEFVTDSAANAAGVAYMSVS